MILTKLILSLGLLFSSSQKIDLSLPFDLEIDTSHMSEWNLGTNPLNDIMNPHLNMPKELKYYLSSPESEYPPVLGYESEALNFRVYRMRQGKSAKLRVHDEIYLKFDSFGPYDLETYNFWLQIKF